jgi:peptide/nickel transport system ATP-binding protein
MLRIENLSVSFRRHQGGRTTPLKGVSLNVARGELVGLIGGSGAGKSLLAEAVMGLLPRNAEVAGSLSVDGQALRPGAPLPTGVLALAPQGIDALDPLARVGTQMERFARLAHRSVDAPALMRSLGLSAAAARAYPHELSGGMAKRALIATALASGAKLLIADEPTLGLDPDLADSLMALLGRLAEQGTGVLLISHDLPRLVALSERVTILQEGAMVETAPASAFADGTLQHPFSRELWAAQTWSEAC